MENEARCRRRHQGFCIKVWSIFSGATEGSKRQNGAEAVFKEIIAKFFPELTKHTNP